MSGSGPFCSPTTTLNLNGDRKSRPHALSLRTDFAPPLSQEAALTDAECRPFSSSPPCRPRPTAPTPTSALTPSPTAVSAPFWVVQRKLRVRCNVKRLQYGAPSSKRYRAAYPVFYGIFEPLKVVVPCGASTLPLMDLPFGLPTKVKAIGVVVLSVRTPFLKVPFPRPPAWTWAFTTMSS